MDKRFKDYFSIKGIFWIALFTFFGTDSQARELYQLIRQFTVQDGMASNSVLNMTRDVRGYYWIATSIGLSRYDGNRFINFYYDESDSNTISNNWVTDILIDKKGMIWVGTRNGVCTIDPYSLKVSRLIPPEAGVRNTLFFVNDLVYSASDQLYAATNEGVYQIDASTMKCFKYVLADSNHVLNHTAIYRMEVDGGERFLLSLPSKVLLVENHQICHEVKLNDKEIIDRMFWAKDNVYLLSSQGGVFRFTPSNQTISKETALSQMGIFNGFYQDFYPELIFTNSSGVYLKALRNDSISLLLPWEGRLKYSDKAGIIFLQLEDNKLWVSTQSALYLWEKRRMGIQTFDLMNQLPKGRRNELVNISSFNKKGECWISLIDSGLIKYNIYQNKIKPLSPGLTRTIKPSTYIKEFVILNDSIFFILCPDQDLIHFNVNTEVARPFHEIYGGRKVDRVNAFLMGSDSTCWIGKEDGLYRYKTGSERLTKLVNRNVKETREQFSQNINQIIQDKYGVIWFSTLQMLQHLPCIGRVMPFEDSISIFLNKKDQRPGTSIISNFESLASKHDSRIWVASSAGLGYWNSTGSEITSEFIYKKEGLPFDYARGLTITDLGVLWMTTINGVFKFDYLKNTVVRYLISDGLFDNNSWNIFLRGNKIYLPYSGAFSMLAPDELDSNTIRTVFGISSIEINNQVVPLTIALVENGSVLKLKFRENQITFQISKSLIDQSDNFFKYKLMPLDKEWKSSNAKEINYNVLSPGNYLFQLTTHDHTNSFRFDINEPYWQTGWFKLLVGICIVSLVRYYIFVREKIIMDKFQLRQKISSDLHDDVGSTLTSINILSNVYETIVQVSPDEASKLVKNIATQSKAIQQNISDIVWAIRPDNERLNDLISRMREFTGDTLEKLDIKVEYQLQLAKENVWLPMELRKDFLLLFKEAINNIVKHAAATEVTIGLRQEGENLQLRVSDNGHWSGITRTSGLGTTSMEIRAKKMNGAVHITPSPKGTEVEVTIRISG